MTIILTIKTVKATQLSLIKSKLPRQKMNLKRKRKKHWIVSKLKRLKMRARMKGPSHKMETSPSIINLFKKKKSSLMLILRQEESNVPGKRSLKLQSTKI
jgi:hypothetical protein